MSVEVSERICGVAVKFSTFLEIFQYFFFSSCTKIVFTLLSEGRLWPYALRGVSYPQYTRDNFIRTEKNGFVTATKLGTTDKIFVAATKRFVDRTQDFVDEQKPFFLYDRF